MSSERLRTQVQFESILSGNDPTVWLSMREKQIKNFELTASHNIILESALKEDAIDFYFKGILSLYDALISIDNKNYSWATVKLYYSVFYLLRSSLSCNNIAFVRRGRECFQFQNKISEKPKKVSALHKSDHKAAIELFKEYNSKTDFLQSNTIDNKNPYEWYMEQRENINYKFRTFYEPDSPSFWETVSSGCDSEGIEYWIQKYISDDIYSFLDDHAIMALPIRRLILTHSDLLKQNIKIIVRLDKEEKLNQMIKDHKYLTHFKLYNRGKI